MPRERIVALPTSENFWSVGGPGPCGPDSEIYWDWGAEHGCGEPGCAPACPRCDRFLEFWNLVFMEYELHADGTLTPLPKQNVDTGMGLERLSAIVQDVPTARSTRPTATSDHALDRGRERRPLGRRRPSDQGAPRARRPRPRDDVPRRRRRRAVERGPRLRAAADHPARRPAGAGDRARRPVAHHRRRLRTDGAVVPGAGRAPRAHPAGRARRGGALLRDARARAEAVRGHRREGRDHRARRVRARDDVRLPGRADPRAGPRARARRRRGRAHALHGGAPRDLACRRVRARRAAGGRVRGVGRLPHRVRRLRRRPRC